MPDNEHGPLPRVLMLLTLVTGLVDAVSYLRLGHVFVANMTGNIVFLGFALAGARDVNILASLAALVAFAVGALVGGRLGVAYGSHRGQLLAIAAAVKVVLVAVAVIDVALFARAPEASPYAAIGLLALAMGVQNAVARRIAVADLTTTVLTMTITGLAADSAWAGGKNRNVGRRVFSVLVMLLGALIGGAIVSHVGVAAALSVAVVLLAIVGGVMLFASRGPAAPWTKAP